jgi:hypothetical protein
VAEMTSKALSVQPSSHTLSSLLWSPSGHSLPHSHLCAPLSSFRDLVSSRVSPGRAACGVCSFLGGISCVAVPLCGVRKCGWPVLDSLLPGIEKWSYFSLPFLCGLKIRTVYTKIELFHYFIMHRTLYIGKGSFFYI